MSAATLPRVVVVVPAHDEAAALPTTLASVRAQTRPVDRVVVVSDRSTDATVETARRLGAEVAVNASTTDPAAYLKREIGGAHGALITAVSPKAFEQALGMVRRGGTVSLNGLPPGDFPLSIFDMVLNGVTVRGSIVGSRLDLQESLQFAAEGKVHATVATERLENVNEVFDRMRRGQIEGRIVLDLA